LEFAYIFLYMIFSKKMVRLLFVFSLLAVAAGGAAAQPLEITVCSLSHRDKDVSRQLSLLKRMGVTSIQTYVYWNKVEKEPGQFDWSEYDADVELFKKHGLRWVPFIIAGPWYVTPEFVRQDRKIVMLRCLEHGRESAIPSIWCPRLRDYVREYLKAFAEHYLPMDVLESINLGISGDYGEAIYSVIGNWPGEYHSHRGFWCGDALARANFKRAMSELYRGDIAALNRAWKSEYESFDDLAPLLPEKAPSLRAKLEFFRWYREAMSSWADFWLDAARQHFPETELYLCTGGDMSPEHGSDFSAQAKIAAKYGGGIRITNEASSFPHNFRLTRLVASSCRFYGAYFGHEPASAVTPVGMLGRLFNAVTSGARQLFLYNTPELIATQDGKPGIGQGGEFHLRYRDWQSRAEPVIDLALLYPTSSPTHEMRETGTFGDFLADFRRFVDYDLVDERMASDGALDKFAVLVLARADALEEQTLQRIKTWVEGGGVLFVLGCLPKDWDGDGTLISRMAGLTSASDEIQGISELAVDAPQRMPSLAGLRSGFITSAFADIAVDAEPLLSMRYTAKGKVAWKRKLGEGWIYVYFGPMDLRQREEAWMVARSLPLLFLRDGIRDSIAEGVLKKMPASFNLDAPDVFLVETAEGLVALNMSAEEKIVKYPGGTFAIEGRSLLKVKK
jgi:hypothetical protein